VDACARYTDQQALTGGVPYNYLPHDFTTRDCRKLTVRLCHN
jgi:hypothetical protein